MEKIQKEHLTGFRSPSQSEKKKIQAYLLKEFNRIRRLMRSGSIVFAVLFVSMLSGVVEQVKESFFNSGELIVNFMLTILFAGCFLLLHERRVRNRILIEKIGQGEFFVLDCHIYEIDMATDKAETADVYICTRDGQYCRDRFRVDLNTVLIYQQGGEIPLLLMKCSVSGKNMDYFEMFTEEKLQIRRKK